MSRKTTGTPGTTRRRVAVGTALLSVTALLGSGLASAAAGDPAVTSFKLYDGTDTGASPVGPLKGGNSSIAVKGSNLDKVTHVWFGGTPASKILAVSSSLLYVTPPAADDDGAVAVKIGTGTQALADAADVLGSGTDYTYTAGPVIDTVVVSGKDMTINGAQFTGATAVLVGDVLVKLKAADVTDAKVTLKAPAVKSGSVDVSVVTPNGVGTKANAYGATPVISKIVLATETNLKTAKAVTGASSATGTVAVGTASTATVTTHSADTGTVVIITGTGFSGLTKLKFGAAEASYTIVNDGALWARIPAKASADALDTKGQFKAKVVAFRGTQESKPVNFTYFAVPAVTAVSDLTGATKTVNTLTITGTGLYSAKVTFGGKAGTVSGSGDSISVSTPKVADAGEAEIKVTTPNGFFIIPNKYNFTANGASTTVPWPSAS